MQSNVKTQVAHVHKFAICYLPFAFDFRGMIYCAFFSLADTDEDAIDEAALVGEAAEDDDECALALTGCETR